MIENIILGDPLDKDFAEYNAKGWYIVAVVFNDVSRKTEVYMARNLIEVKSADPELIATVEKLSTELDTLKQRIATLEAH